MDTVVEVDQPDPSAQCPALEPINHPQFHEIPIAVDDFSPIAPPRFSPHLSPGVGPFAEDDVIVECHGAWAITKHARLGAKSEGTERKHDG
jgi:hypothetical protein